MNAYPPRSSSGMSDRVKGTSGMQNYWRQKGFATIVFVMLVGLGIAATGAGVLHSVENTQQKNIAVNSITHSQTGAWAGAEAFRLYLTGLTTSGVTALSQNLTIGMDASYGTLTASNIQVTDLGTGTYRVSTDIVNIHAAAKSSAALSVVYDVTPGTATGLSMASPEPIDAINFADDLTLQGGIDLTGVDGGTFDLNVKGDVDLGSSGGVSDNPIGAIQATGTVTIGSRVTVDSIYANEDVTLANTTVQSVSTLGDFYASGSAAVSHVWANGDVTIEASGRFDLVYSLASVTILTAGATGHGYINAGEEISIQRGAGPVEELQAVDDIDLETSAYIGDSISMSDIRCIAPYWNSFNSLSANGNLNNCASSNSSGSTDSAVSGASRVVTTMAPLELYTQTESVIDVWEVKDEANYFISYDTSADRIKVTVNNVAGIADGTEYLIADYNGNYRGSSYKDYLCSSVSGSGNCTSPSEPLIPLCLGYSIYNSCISYSAYNDTFSIIPSTTAPGVMFFDGNLSLGTGYPSTTFLASGNIETSGQFESESANFASYDETCLAEGSSITSSDIRNRYTAEYSEHFPSNLCDIEAGTYTSTSTGNIGLAAGGINPDGDGSYSGGDITLGASTVITGAVLAGNLLETGGQTVIYGAVSSTASRSTDSDGNNLGGSTTIDLSQGTDSYDPTALPDMSGEKAEAQTTTTVTTTAQMLWARYL